MVPRPADGDLERFGHRIPQFQNALLSIRFALFLEIFQRPVAVREESLDAADRLTGPVFVLDQGEPHAIVAVFAEADARVRRATLASRRSSFENSNEPRCLNGSGIGAQANIVACGLGTSHPAECSPSINTSRRFL